MKIKPRRVVGRGGLGCAATVERARKQCSSEMQDLTDDLKDEKRELYRVK